MEKSIADLGTGYKPYLFVLAAGFIFLSCLIDFAETIFKSSEFYLSESLLFASFWLLLIPMIGLQKRLLNKSGTLLPRIGCIIAPMLIQLLIFPVLIWIISVVFLDHSYAYGGTLEYLITTQAFKLLLIYLGTFLFFAKLPASKAEVTPQYIFEILVKSNHVTIGIPICEIAFFTANSPYLSFPHNEKKHLITDTLKSLSERVDPNMFCRIHKSTLVNLQMVQTFTSRQNGDYDLTMTDGKILRLSRSYAAEFKLRFTSRHSG